MTAFTASLQHSPAGTSRPGAVPLWPRCMQRTMRWRQLPLNHTIACSGGDQPSTRDGCPHVTSPPTLALDDAAPD
jgi:hypothetical protein